MFMVFIGCSMKVMIYCYTLIGVYTFAEILIPINTSSNF